MTVMWKEEEAFINDLKSGNEKAYHTLITVYSKRVYNLCLQFVSSPQDAEDTTQEVFTTIYLSMISFRKESSLSTWIYRITVNKCRELNRKKSRKKRFGIMRSWDETPENYLESSNQDPEKTLLNSELAETIQKAIEGLPENQRIAYTLSKLEGIKNDAIADIMELSVSAVESLLFRAKKSVTEQLNNYLIPE
jgi:RNA polymerase sigma factor (sigma-70 family)